MESAQLNPLGGCFPSSGRGGFPAVEWSRRVAASHGDVVRAVKTWLVESGRAAEDAEIVCLEIRP
ncbi:hypothetical protein KPATCC21470_0044 [Kitasatospora purpeofusca]